MTVITRFPALAASMALLLAAACSKAPSPTRADSVHPADPPSAAGAVAPRLSAYGDRVVMSWVEPTGAEGGSLRYAVRENGAWSAPRTAASDPRLASDPSDVPGVVPLGGGVLAAHGDGKGDGAEHARDLLAAVSSDGGATWSAPVRPHRDETAAEHGMATLVPLPEPGRFGLTWLDGRAGELASYGEGGTGLYWAEWNGTSFDAETVLDPRVCDCCKTAGAAGTGGPLIVYRDREEDEARDTSIVREQGGTWLPPAHVHVDGWRLTACPTNGPAVATRGERAVIAWFTGASNQPSVWAMQSGDDAKTFAQPVRIDNGGAKGRVDTAILPDGSAVVAWLEKAGESGEVRVRRIAPDGTPAEPIVLGQTSAARSSGYPRIVPTGDREVLAAWTETGSPGKLRAALVTVP